MHPYLLAAVFGVIATILAYGLNLVFDFTDTSAETWVGFLAAFVVGSLLGEWFRQRQETDDARRGPR